MNEREVLELLKAVMLQPTAYGLSWRNSTELAAEIDRRLAALPGEGSKPKPVLTTQTLFGRDVYEWRALEERLIEQFGCLSLPELAQRVCDERAAKVCECGHAQEAHNWNSFLRRAGHCLHMDWSKSGEGFNGKSCPCEEFKAASTVPRCEVCDWPMGTEPAACKPDDCRYRPSEGSDEWRRIKARRADLAKRDAERAAIRDEALERAARVCDEHAAENDEIADKVSGGAVGLDIKLRRRANATSLRSAAASIRALKSTAKLQGGPRTAAHAAECIEANASTPTSQASGYDASRVAGVQHTAPTTPAVATTVCAACGHEHRKGRCAVLVGVDFVRPCGCPAFQAQAQAGASNASTASTATATPEVAKASPALSTPDTATPAPQETPGACPKCDNEPVRVRQIQSYWRVECFCGIETMQCSTREDAVRMWNSNRRPVAPSVEQVVEAVERAGSFPGTNLITHEAASAAIRAAFARSSP